MRPAGVDRYVPVAYFGVALLLVLTLIPTALRPPQPPPPSSAELSPDAPPDEQQILLTELNRGRSGTAGTGTTDLAIGTDTAAPPAPGRPRSCAFGFGDPPRQTESLYAAPCAPAFQGDNGGATARGVTATEVRVAIAPHRLQAGINQATEGRVEREPRPRENAQDRTLRVYQQYFNTRFQTYGRYIQLYVSKQGQSVEAERAAAQRADEEYRVFAMEVIGGTAHDEAMRRKLVTFGTQGNPADFHERNAPYAWAFWMDGDKLVDFDAELICKQLAGRPPTFNERADATFDYAAPRRFGVLSFNDETHYGYPDRMNEKLAACGERLRERVYFNITFDAQSIASAVTRMRAAGVTTIVCLCDNVSPVGFTNEANNQAYNPEWLMGTGHTDRNDNGRLYNAAQWRHAFGIAPNEIARAAAKTDWYRAYTEIDPDNAPNDALAIAFFHDLLQIMNGIQLAGPKLTAETFRAGLFSMPRHAPEPIWSIGGGYGPGDYTYTDYASLVWWDTTGSDPSTPNQPGAYRHLFGGKRFKLGEIPNEPLPYFRAGVTSVD